MAIIQGSAKSSARGFYPLTIDQSLRFNDDDSANLSRTFSAGNRKTWTWSGWVKRAGTGTRQWLFSTGTGGADYGHCMIDSDDKLYYLEETPTLYRIGSTALFRDFSAWYHIMFVVDTTNATSNDRIRYYVNGERVDVGVFNVQPPQNTDLVFNQARSHSIGANASAAQYIDGYLAEINFVDGQALEPSSFGETKSGVWIPKAYSGSYGTNGFYLDFANSADIGNDVSGNSNDWTPNNFTASDVVLDSPTDNFVTMNPLHGVHGCTLSDGNLRVVTPDNKSAGSTIAPTSGQWYAEVTVNSSLYVSIGVCRDDEVFGTNLNASGEAWMYSYVGTVYKKGTSDTTPVSFTTGDVISICLDLDNQKLYFLKNGAGITTSEGTHVVGTTGISIDAGYGYYFCTTSNGNNADCTWNFGQQPFKYDPPA